MTAVHPPLPDPAPANRAERRAKKKHDLGTVRERGSDGPARPARSTAQGRRILPIRRTG